MECRPTATIVDLLRVVIVLVATATITVTEALAVTTTKTAVIGRLHVADPLMNTVPHLVDVMMTPTDGIIRPPTRMSTGVLMTAPRETSLREKVAMVHVKVVRSVRIIGEATGKQTS